VIPDLLGWLTVDLLDFAFVWTLGLEVREGGCELDFLEEVGSSLSLLVVFFTLGNGLLPVSFFSVAVLLLLQEGDGEEAPFPLSLFFNNFPNLSPVFCFEGDVNGEVPHDVAQLFLLEVAISLSVRDSDSCVSFGSLKIKKYYYYYPLSIFYDF
jgi:hypothetical protein